MASDFWRRSGYHLLEHRDDGSLAVTDEFLRAYLLRPEMAPVPDSCPAERQLQRDLVADPRLPVAASRLAAVADPDARENYAVLLRFRDALTAAGSLEAFYLAVAQGRLGALPRLFIDHVVQAIVRHLLHGCGDAVRVRAAELLFRTQRVTIDDGAILLVDEETVTRRAAAADGARAVELDILHAETAEGYWRRSDAFDTVFNASLVSFGQDALARVLEAWINHFLKVETVIQPVASIRDERWRWHVGLDAEASVLLNDLYDGRNVAPERLARLLALFRLTFREPGLVRPEMAGRPVYLAMAMSADAKLRLKPQNLLVNLPLPAPA